MSNIKCGHCHEYHTSVNEVRSCAKGELANRYPNAFGGRTYTASGRFEVIPNRITGGTTTVPRRSLTGAVASERQIKFIKDLVDERQIDTLPFETLDIISSVMQNREITRTQASETITALQTAPYRGSNCSETDVPEGHYAVPSATGNNDLDFFRVDRPTEGRWAGRVFVKRVVGGKPDFSVHRNQVPGILARIEAAGVQDSALLYGREIGRCCKCNRHLTDETSRAYGMGPDCRANAGW